MMMMMPKHNLFAKEEQGSRCSKLGEPLIGLSNQVDFAALADDIGADLPRSSHVVLCASVKLLTHHRYRCR